MFEKLKCLFSCHEWITTKFSLGGADLEQQCLNCKRKRDWECGIWFSGWGKPYYERREKE
jgi:hypothetical protein